MNKKYPLYSDAVVSYEDATRFMNSAKWKSRALMGLDLAAAEPALAGIAISWCENLRMKLKKLGASEPIIEEAVACAHHAQILVLQMYREGTRKLWDDLIKAE